MACPQERDAYDTELEAVLQSRFKARHKQRGLQLARQLSFVAPEQRAKLHGLQAILGGSRTLAKTDFITVKQSTYNLSL